MIDCTGSGARARARASATLAPMARIEIGDEAPEFELAGTGEQTFRLSDLRGSWMKY